MKEITINAWKKLEITLASPVEYEANASNLSSNCPSLERVKACPPDQAERGNKKICCKLMALAASQTYYLQNGYIHELLSLVECNV